MSEQTILPLYHPDAMNLFNVNSDLAHICVELRDLKKSVPKFDIHIGYLFAPQRSQTFTSYNNTLNLMDNQKFWIQTKLDGERIQMHYNNGVFNWFSRGRTDYSDLYGRDFQNGAIAPFIFKCFKDHVKSIVLDGEMLSFDTETRAFEKFGQLKPAIDSVLKHGAASKTHPCYVLFDVLYLNGSSLVSQPLEQRDKILQSSLNQKESFLEILPHQVCITENEILKALEERIDQNEEGIIMKNPRKEYTHGLDNSAWIKLKPEHIPGMSDDLDLLLVGGNYSKRHKDKLSRFIFAVKDDNIPDLYYTICEVGSGFTSSELPNISKEAEKKWDDYDPKKPPSWLIHSNTKKERQPIKILNPQHSHVVQVRATQIVQSEVYGSGLTLRFPRIIAVRDKLKDDILSLQEARKMAETGKMQTSSFSSQGSSLNSFSQSSQLQFVAKKTKRKGLELAENTSRRQKATISVLSPSTSLRAVEVEISLFSGKTFYVTDALDRNIKRQDLLANIQKYGGIIVANPIEETIIVADKATVKVQNYINGKKYDVMKTNYLLNCFEKRIRLEYNKKNFLYTTEATAKVILDLTDEYGDSYCNDITAQELKELVCELSGSTFTLLNGHNSEEFDKMFKLNKKISEIDAKYSGPLKINIFANCIVYVDECIDENIEKLLFLYGALTTKDTDKHTTHIVTNANRVAQWSTTNIHIVSVDWIMDSIQDGEKKLEFY
jgi:DNA ligase-4